MGILMAFLVEAGSGVLTEGIAGCLGIPNDSIKNTLVGVYNDMEQVRCLFEAYGDDIAAVIIEPVAGNMGVVKAEDEFMETLRVLCDEYGSLLIFDEVMSGFRVAYKGAQSLFNVKPDLITYAKIIGGGLPCGVYGGRRDIMEKLSPCRRSISSWYYVRKSSCYGSWNGDFKYIKSKSRNL